VSWERGEEEEVEVEEVEDDDESSLSSGADRAVGNSVARARAITGKRALISGERRRGGGAWMGGSERIMVDEIGDRSSRERVSKSNFFLSLFFCKSKKQ
jgi:hypothetical protein